MSTDEACRYLGHRWTSDGAFCKSCGLVPTTPFNGERMPNKSTLKRWKIDAGNSTTGPCGFVIYNLLAESKEAALTKIRETFALPEYGETTGEDNEGNETNVRMYFNGDFVTLDNIEEDDFKPPEWAEEDDPDDEALCRCGHAKKVHVAFRGDYRCTADECQCKDFQYAEGG